MLREPEIIYGKEKGRHMPPHNIRKEKPHYRERVL